MSSYSDVSKVMFSQKYGSEAHKRRSEHKIGEIIRSGDKNAIGRIASEELPLKDEHIHSIIDHPAGQGGHPARLLAQYHKDKLTDEHWEKMAKHLDKEIQTTVLASAPLRHVKTMAMTHPDPFIRQMATNQYVNKKRAGYPE